MGLEKSLKYINGVLLSQAIDSAIRTLKMLGAIEQNGSDLKLTALGKRMSAFPIDPKLSRVLLAAEQFGCLEEALSVVALTSCDSIVVSQSAKVKFNYRIPINFVQFFSVKF